MSSASKKPNAKRIIDLQEFLLKFRAINRIIHLKHESIQLHENDVEHSYSLAMTAWFLAQYFPELNKDKIIRFALAHDIVEVYAGDTFAFADEKILSTKRKREEEASQKIKLEWPDFPDMNQIIADYEAKISPEAKFVYALDKIMPIVMNILNDGYTWHTEKISLMQLHNNKHPKVAVSKEIKPYYDQLYKFLNENLHLFPANT